MAPLGGNDGHKSMSNREARSWTEGIITEQRSEAAFNKYRDEPLPPSALPPRHKAAAATSSANQRGSSDGVIVPAIDMTNAHQDHGIETMEATRQNRRMPAHMRGEADEAIYGRDLDGSTMDEAREAHIHPELWTGPRIPLRKTLPVAHHAHHAHQKQETVLRKKAMTSAEVRMRALQGDGLHKKPHRSLQEPALKPGQVAHNTSDNFHAAPFMSKNRAVEQWTTYRNAINPMLQLSPGDPRLPEHARQCFSNTMLTHSSLNSVAGRSTMQTMQRLTNSSLRSPVASRSPESARPHTSSSAQLRLPPDATSSASSGPSPAAPRQLMRTPTMAATAMTQTIQPAIPHSRSTPNFGSVGGGAFGSGSSFGSTRGLHNTLAAAQSLAAVEVADMFTRMANAETLRPLTAATTIKRERQRIDAQPGMIWNQTYASQKNGDAPGWRVLTPAENVARRSGVMTRAGL